MPRDDDGRQDPFRSIGTEPVDEMTMGTVPAVLQQRPGGKGRQTAIRPTDKRRRKRQFSVTFSSPSTVSRLRALAEQWGWRSNNELPNVSRVVEYLLMPRLEAAERGEIGPSATRTETGEQWF